MFGLFDPLFWLIVGPPMLLAAWAQFRVKSAFNKASKQAAMSGMTGARAARELLDHYGLQNVEVERSHDGQLSDHYDPQKKVLRLSEGVYDSNSLAALGIAAHEAGHAIQQAKHYAPLTLRNALVPMAATGGQLASWLIMGGILLSIFAQGGGAFAQTMIMIGIAGFSAVVLFQLVNLPVEFDASSRAKAALVEYGMVHESEMGPVKRVLSAAAMTYVAATLIALAQIIWLLLRFGGGGE